MKIKISPTEALQNLAASGKLFTDLFRHGTLSVEIYKPEKTDKQQPHDRDEIYVVIAGTGKYESAGQVLDFAPGDFLFAPAHVAHRFTDFSDNFSTWVFFYGPVGGEVPAKSEIKIERWKPEFQPAFFALNKQWIEVDYPLEPLDIAVLSDPESHILNGGGSILSAVLDGEVVGVVALRHTVDGIFELTKMAVNTSFRGKGLGEKLMLAAIDEARNLKAARLILFSNSITSAAAVNLYRKVGFLEISLGSAIYKRANIKMEFPL